MGFRNNSNARKGFMSHEKLEAFDKMVGAFETENTTVSIILPKDYDKNKAVGATCTCGRRLFFHDPMGGWWHLDDQTRACYGENKKSIREIQESLPSGLRLDL